MPLLRWATAIQVARYEKCAILGACHRTSNDFSVTCHSKQRAWQPSSRPAISFDSFMVAEDFVLQLIRFEHLESELQES